MLELHASNPAEVSSASSIVVALNDPATSLMIFSGIAVPELRVNDDDKVYPGELLVRLGVSVVSIIEAVSHIGLASISNDETAFTFAVDAGVLEVEPGTGELRLRVQTGLRGEKTYLHRFGYQVVARVRNVWARISGTIILPKETFDLGRMPVDKASAQFDITANTVKSVNTGQTFPTLQITPVAWGQITGLRTDDANCYADYAIDGCPLGQQLHVMVFSADALAMKPEATFGQIAGPDPILLSNIEPTKDGIDFGISKVIVK